MGCAGLGFGLGLGLKLGLGTGWGGGGVLWGRRSVVEATPWINPAHFFIRKIWSLNYLTDCTVREAIQVTTNPL